MMLVGASGSSNTNPLRRDSGGGGTPKPSSTSDSGGGGASAWPCHPAPCSPSSGGGGGASNPGAIISSFMPGGGGTPPCVGSKCPWFCGQAIPVFQIELYHRPVTAVASSSHKQNKRTNSQYKRVTRVSLMKDTRKGTEREREACFGKLLEATEYLQR